MPAMQEIVPGVHVWSARHDGIGMTVHSAYVAAARALIDPMLPPGGVDAVAALGGPPERVLLTIRHHYRQADAFVDAFGCSVHCHEAGLHEFEGGPEVHGFAPGDEVAPGIVVCEVGAICPDECALHIAAWPGALACADGVVRWQDGDPLGFVPDGLLGDDPEAVKAGLRAAYARIADELEFEALLLAHGGPTATGGREALARFAAG
jgi:hypothetical protein